MHYIKKIFRYTLSILPFIYLFILVLTYSQYILYVSDITTAMAIVLMM